MNPQTSFAGAASPGKSPKSFGRQSIHGPDGAVVRPGGWNARLLAQVVTPRPGYWRDRRVLDIGANTGGLSLELARAGAEVVALEPRPMHRAEGAEHIAAAREAESLSIRVLPEGLFDAHRHGAFDTVLCLGLLYHFRDPLYVLSYLSTVDTQDLIVSTQVSPGDRWTMLNRRDPTQYGQRFDIRDGRQVTGWHPTRPLLEAMLREAGFEDAVELRQPPRKVNWKPAPGVTNGAYYLARKARTTDPLALLQEFCPR